MSISALTGDADPTLLGSGPPSTGSSGAWVSGRYGSVSCRGARVAVHGRGAANSGKGVGFRGFGFGAAAVSTLPSGGPRWSGVVSDGGDAKISAPPSGRYTSGSRSGAWSTAPGWEQGLGIVVTRTGGGTTGSGGATTGTGPRTGSYGPTLRPPMQPHGSRRNGSPRAVTGS